MFLSCEFLISASLRVAKVQHCPLRLNEGTFSPFLYFSLLHQGIGVETIV